MKHEPSSGKHEVLDKPVYYIPDRHAEGGKGDRPDGTLVHGTTYKQPWGPGKDGVLPDEPEKHIG